MRYLLIIASALFAFGTTMTFESTEANAVVCAKGVYRAGCAGTRGAVVVRKPAVGLQDRVGERREGSPLHLSPQRFHRRPSHAGLPQSGQPFADRTGGADQTIYVRS